MNYNEAAKLISDAKRIVVVQSEIPDGDSLGSSLALEEILGDMGKEVSLFCPSELPEYIHYIQGWDRVTTEFDTSVDLAIIVDTSSETLLSRVLETPGARSFFETHPVVVIDHHATESTLSFDHIMVADTAVATSQVIFDFADSQNWTINSQAAENMLASILSDSLGMTTQNVNADTYRVASELAKRGASPAVIEERRREFMKKAPEILAYKGELLTRIEYAAGGRLAMVHIPWEEIRQYSSKYNPSVLVLDEMRLVTGVELAVAIKTYRNGRVTGKLRGNLPIAEDVAAHFGGGGHVYAAGFRAHDEYDTIVSELIKATEQASDAYHDAHTS